MVSAGGERGQWRLTLGLTASDAAPSGTGRYCAWFGSVISRAGRRAGTEADAGLCACAHALP